MKIYTKTGDTGETSLSSGERIGKDHPRVAAYGSLDEMNSALGVAAASGPGPEVKEAIALIQRMVFELGSDLATVPKPGALPRIGAAHVRELERGIDEMSAKIPPVSAFVFPGGSLAAAQIHVARAVCRRTEREVIAVSRLEAIPREAAVFLNRLSDYLFTLARYENFLSGVPETAWTPAKQVAGNI